MKQWQTLILGNGQIGRSLYNVLHEVHDNVEVWDTSFDKHNYPRGYTPDIMHVTFPYSETFVEDVKKYQEDFKPTYTIIHSTVPFGTSKACNAIHSPIIGMHPNLELSLKTFTKMFSGIQASGVVDYFKAAGIKTYIFPAEGTTEILKPADTTFYALCVEYTKQIYKTCTENGVPFESWTVYNDIYNKGYTELGRNEYVRPNLVPVMQEIGGHCLLPNLPFFDNPFSQLIAQLNGK